MSLLLLTPAEMVRRGLIATIAPLWPRACLTGGCISHLGERVDGCKCPQKYVPGGGAHILQRNGDCTAHTNWRNQRRP